MELFTNFASTTLNGTILSGAGSLVVTSATAFPATGNFRILVENEIMLVTAVSTNTFTITRAQEGTTATNHNSGVLVTHIITAASHVQAVLDRAGGYGTYAARPTASFAGRQYIASDGIVPFVDDGTTWHPLIAGVPGVEVAPGNSLAAFTAFNVSNLTSTLTGGCAYLRVPTSNGSTQLLQGYEIARSAGQTCTCFMKMHAQPGNATTALGVAGIYLRDHTVGHLTNVNIAVGNAGVVYVAVDEYNSATSFNGNQYEQPDFLTGDGGYWLRIRDDGVNFNFEWSADGSNYWTLVTQAISGNFIATPDRFGMYLNAYSRPTAVTYESFKVA